VTLVQLKTSAFLVGKEGLNVRPFTIPVTRGPHAGQVTDQVNGFGEGSPPPRDHHHGAVGVFGEQHALAKRTGAANHRQVFQARPRLTVCADLDVLGGDGFVRLNFGCPRSMLLEALDRMKQALK
jgi:hypothetical protein